MGGRRQRGIVASETTVAMKRNDKIGQPYRQAPAPGEWNDYTEGGTLEFEMSR